MDEEVKKEFEKVWKRIKELEDKKEIRKIDNGGGKKYKGLGGGLNLLIENGFFKNPKILNEIIEEMKREGYHHGKGAVSKMLSVNFVKSKKILTRIKENNIWKYVIRK